MVLFRGDQRVRSNATGPGWLRHYECRVIARFSAPAGVRPARARGAPGPTSGERQRGQEGGEKGDHLPPFAPDLWSGNSDSRSEQAFRAICRCSAGDDMDARLPSQHATATTSGIATATAHDGRFADDLRRHGRTPSALDRPVLRAAQRVPAARRRGAARERAAWVGMAGDRAAVGCGAVGPALAGPQVPGRAGGQTHTGSGRPDGLRADRLVGHDTETVMAMMWGYDWGWGAWLLMSVMMVLFWGLVIAGIVVLVRYLTSSRQGGTPASDSGRSSAEEILAERFARGEIDEDEYTRRRRLLRGER